MAQHCLSPHGSPSFLLHLMITTFSAAIYLHAACPGYHASQQQVPTVPILQPPLLACAVAGLGKAIRTDQGVVSTTPVSEACLLVMPVVTPVYKLPMTRQHTEQPPQACM